MYDVTEVTRYLGSHVRDGPRLSDLGHQAGVVNNVPFCFSQVRQSILKSKNNLKIHLCVWLHTQFDKDLWEIRYLCRDRNYKQNHAVTLKHNTLMH